MKNLCEYPFVLLNTADQRDDKSRFTTTDAHDDLLSRGGLPRINTGVSGARVHLNNKSYSTLNGQGMNGTENKRALIKQAELLDENRIVLYKKGMQLGPGYFIIEISSNNSCLFIAAYDVESPESLLIELPEKKAEEIMREFNNDYEALAGCLQVMNKRLVLLNPKFTQNR